MDAITVLAVDDSITVRKRIVSVLERDPDLRVVGEAGDGARAVELCRTLRPAIVTLDLVLPVMSGLAATEAIMAFCPTPILIVSASSNRGELFRTYDALEAGALDVLEKPTGTELDGAWEERLVRAVKLVSRIKVITHPRGRLGAMGRAPMVGGGLGEAAPLGPGPRPLPRAAGNPPRSVVAIGASTGGPGAVVKILSALPEQCSLPILLCVHMGETLGAAFAEWLDGVVPRPVAYARGGEEVRSLGGRVVMAPPGEHMVVQAGRIALHRRPERHSCRPSVDELFESLATDMGDAVVGCLLTGMGRDGAAGLLAIHQRGGLTIAQDEATSTVYGMPREAMILGAVQHVLPLGAIAGALARAQPRAGGR